MPSFDVVCKCDMQEVDNAVNNVEKEIGQRYDFKGTKCTIERKENEITLHADSNNKLEQIHEMIKVHFTRRKLDAKLLDYGKVEAASGNTVRQTIKVREGIDQDTAKKLVKEIKGTKMKVQAAIQGDQLRITGKKIDDLQEVIAFLKGLSIEVPLQYENFRD